MHSGLFDEIVLSSPPDWIEFIRKHLPSTSIPIQIIAGGSTRQESSYLGLQAFQPKVVVIHDAVRPFVSRKILADNVKAALQMGAVDTCIPSADTLVFAPEGDQIHSIPNRSHYLRGQTPQSFLHSLILDAHQKTIRTNASDDCQLILDLKHPIAIAAGDEFNMKITSELDLALAEQIFRLRCQEIRKPIRTSLEGQRIAVIGGLGGIGAAIAEKLTEFGAIAIPLSRATTPSLDLRKPLLIKKTFQKLGPLDGLINCAGALFTSPLEKLSLTKIQESIDVNLTGLILCCKLAQLKSGAHVINIASSAFSRGRKEMSVYSSAKAGVVNFTQGWTEERPDLRIHTVIPQRTNTAMRRKNFPGEENQTLLSPEEVAESVLDLLFEKELTGLLVEVRKK